jgi:predicted nucleotidyltransferase
MTNDLVRKVGPQAAKRLSAFAAKARALSPLPVIEVLLFGSRARGDAKRGSDWDVAVVVDEGNGIDARKARRSALNIFADIALLDIASGFHLSPIVVPAVVVAPDRIDWRVSPALARNIMADRVLIA